MFEPYTTHQYRRDKLIPYFWLGDIAEQVHWYCENYRGTSLACHLAMIKPEINNLIIFKNPEQAG